MLNLLKRTIVGATKEQTAIKNTQAETSPAVLSCSMETMDSVFSRKAERYCKHCNVVGSHYTERHNAYALVALKLGQE